MNTQEQEKKAKNIEAARVKAGRCRHCGGTLPCWSPYGDESPGKMNPWPGAFVVNL
jgi:hypothetical protein